MARIMKNLIFIIIFNFFFEILLPIVTETIYVEIWFLQILMSPGLYLKDRSKKYLLLVKKDPDKGFVNPYFLQLQQKNVVAGENCPY